MAGDGFFSSGCQAADQGNVDSVMVSCPLIMGNLRHAFGAGSQGKVMDLKLRGVLHAQAPLSAGQPI